MGFQMQRQMSLNVGYDRISKKGKEKMRRSSSADLSSELGLIAEPSMKIMDCCPTNYDSGTEDLSQNETTVDNIAHVNNDHDEGISNTTSVTDENDDYQNQTFQPVPTDSGLSLEQWVEQAKSIDDFEKQQFCGTMEAFHAEFVINFLFPLSKTNLNLNYVLVPISDGLVPGNVYGCCVSVVENAKAQFRCSFCNRCWSSMRARISFDMTHPNVVPGIVYMKIYGQDCDECHHPTRPLWYIDEVCRVMRNVSKTFLTVLIPHYALRSLNYGSMNDSIGRQRRDRSKAIHDPTQRKGSMNSPHKCDSCEACRLHMCFQYLA